MITGRYAPSPSGRMHLGNLMCCLLAWLSAKSKGGQVLLRIEDLDTQRCPRAYADAIIDDLAWLGLAADGPEPPIYQSERSAIYQQYFDELARRGLVYPCMTGCWNTPHAAGMPVSSCAAAPAAKIYGPRFCFGTRIPSPFRDSMPGLD